MKMFVLTAIVLLLALFGGTIADQPGGQCLTDPLLCSQNSNTSEYLFEPKKPAIGGDSPPPSSPPTEFPINEDAWKDAVCRGRRLLQAMTLDDEEEIKTLLGWPFIQSPWDGDLSTELATWGYSVKEEPDKCDFDYWHFGSVLKDLKVNPDQAQKRNDDSDNEKKRDEEPKGRNYCFKIEHNDGPTVVRDQQGKPSPPGKSEQKYRVGGTEYRTTGAFNEVGINTIDGIVYFLDRLSPEMAAQRHWKMENVPPSLLPALRSSSDLTWGLWNRVSRIPPHENGLQNHLDQIKYFLVTNAVNFVTKYTIVPKALKMKGLKSDETKPWPGSGFRIGADGDEGEAALALIGSPNGIAAAYFLIQHKKQLGGSKFIWKVRIFRDDDDEEGLADDYNLLFFVDPAKDPADPPKPPGKRKSRSEEGTKGHAAEGNFESRVVERSRNGKSLLREHVFRARI